jgi:hypothetical protein
MRVLVVTDEEPEASFCEAVRNFAARWSAAWLVKKNGYLSPTEARARWRDANIARPAYSSSVPREPGAVHVRQRLEEGSSLGPNLFGSQPTDHVRPIVDNRMMWTPPITGCVARGEAVEGHWSGREGLELGRWDGARGARACSVRPVAQAGAVLLSSQHHRFML